MATYLIGDVHGCYRELRQLLNQVNFDANQDTLWLTGIWLLEDLIHLKYCVLSKA